MADRSVKVILGANVSGLVNGVRTAKGAVEDFGRSATGWFDKNRESLDQLSGSMIKVGAGLTAVAGFAVKTAMDWEQAWTGVLKTVDGTGPQLARLEGDLRSLARETGFAHDEVAAVAEAAGQLGISTEGISQFTETMLAMGVSTNLSSEEAATGLARFRNIMGSTEGDIAKMGATIVELGNNFATTEAEILAMSMRIAGAGRQIGLTEADVMGLAASMSSVGIEAEAGGTAMSLTMKRIEKAVDGGGSTLQMFADVAGVSAEQFSTRWKDDAAGALTDFVAGLSTVGERGQSANAVLTELGITGIREADALLRLSGNAEGLAEALGVAADGWAENAALMAEAEKFYNTTAQKGKQAWASIKDSAIDAGDALLPVVAKVFDGVSSLAEAFGSLPGPVQGGLTALAGTTGIALLAVGGLIKLTGAIAGTVTAYRALAASSAMASRALGLASRGIGAAIAVLATAEVVDRIGERGADGIDKLAHSLEAFGRTGVATGDLEDLFGKRLGGVVKNLDHDMESIGEAIERFRDYGDDGSLTKIGKFFTTFGKSGAVYTKQAEAIRDMDASFTQLARNNPEGAIRAFEKLRDRALDTGASVESVALAFPTMTEMLRSASESMGGTSNASEILNGDLTELAPAAQQVAEEMQKARDEAHELGSSFFDISEALEGSLSGLTSTLEKQAEQLANFRQNAIEAMRRGADEDFVSYLVSKGPEAAGMLDQLANASEDMINRSNSAFQRMNEEIARFVEYRTGVDWQVVAEFKTAGEDGAIETAVAVAEKLKLSDTEVESVLYALDYASEDIQRVLELMDAADEADAKPKVDVDNSRALGAINTVMRNMGMLNNTHARPTVSIDDSLANQKLFNLQRTLSSLTMGATSVAAGIPQSRRGPTGFANGGILSARARAFADGGIDEYGRSVQRVPQIRGGGQGIVMWGEPETTWEAYVSGKPSMRERNKGVLSEAASRLGGDVTWYANGGITGGADAVSGSELTRLRIRVRDLEADLRKGGKDRLNGLDRLAAQQELSEAKAELRAAQAANSRIWGARHTAETWNAARSTAADFAGNADVEFTTPAGVERQLQRKLAEMGEFTIALADLKRRGASPWLLEQLMQAGPSRSSIRTARQLAQDTARLRRLNAMASQIDQVSGLYGQMTQDPRFLQSSASWGSLTAAHQRVIERTVQVNVTTDDPSRLAREVRRLSEDQLVAMAQGAGV